MDTLKELARLLDEAGLVVDVVPAFRWLLDNDPEKLREALLARDAAAEKRGAIRALKQAIEATPCPGCKKREWDPKHITDEIDAGSWVHRHSDGGFVCYRDRLRALLAAEEAPGEGEKP